MGSWTERDCFLGQRQLVPANSAKKMKKISETSSRLQEVAGLKGNLPKKTERQTPKGKARKPFFPEKKSVAKGKVFSADKENRTFRASECKG